MWTIVDPSRWDSAAGHLQASPFTSPAFSKGPRICISCRFAIMDIETVLGRTVNIYQFPGVVFGFAGKE